jgi:hypothetical protein
VSREAGLQKKSSVQLTLNWSRFILRHRCQSNRTGDVLKWLGGAECRLNYVPSKRSSCVA